MLQFRFSFVVVAKDSFLWCYHFKIFVEVVSFWFFQKLSKLLSAWYKCWTKQTANNTSRMFKFQKFMIIERFAILSALDWMKSQKKRVIFFSDSLSSLQAIYTFRTKDPLVLAIKNKLMHLGGLAYLAHVSSHICVIGSEHLLRKVLL